MKKFNQIEEAIAAVADGEMVVVLDDEERENEGDLVMAAQMVTPAMVNFMAKEGRGLICVPVDFDIAERLDFRPMVDVNEDERKCNFTVSVDFRSTTTTGISASDRAKTIRAIADYHSVSEDFARPGHIFPLLAKRGGVLVRAGHTEAAVDLVRMAGLTPAAVICEIAREDGEMMRRDELLKFAAAHSFKIITIKDLIEYRHRREKLVKLVAEAMLPTEYGNFEMKIYKTTVDDSEHVALVMGKWKAKQTVLVRVHSECLTGEVFGSQRCDCKQQLHGAMKKIAEAGKGVILYMRQEGRGIGLVNKVKAYNLQDGGLDTVEANERLGFPPDLRHYGLGAQILADLGVKNMNLMTNNPTKVVGLKGYGLNIVSRVPLEILPTDRNRGYLQAKKKKMGHILRHV